MKADQFYRKGLIFHLNTGAAHMRFEEAVANFPSDKINEKFPNGTYTFWHLLEHMRITQKDILSFIKNQNYKELKWPKDYWPDPKEKATQQDWDKTIQSFLSDRKKLVDIVEDPASDLMKELPNGTGQTLSREIAVVTDHNAYHIGELAIMRQVLDAWGKDHK